LAFSVQLPSWLRVQDWFGGAHGGTGLGARLTAPQYPPIVFDLDPNDMAMVQVGRRKDERYIADFKIEKIPKGLIETDFYKVKVTARNEFLALLNRLHPLEKDKQARISFLLPDNYARVAILSFDDMPRKRQDALELVRWKTKKAVPFKVEEAAVDFMPLSAARTNVDVLAVLTPRSVMAEFETAFTALGMHPGLVDVSTLSLLNLFRPILQKELVNGDECLLANVSPGFVTFVIFRGERMVLFRCKPFATGVENDNGVGAMRLMKRELQSSLLYYQEKLDGKGLSRSYLRVSGHEPRSVESLFKEQAEIGDVLWLNPRELIATDGRLAGEEGDRILQRLAPALGAAIGRELR
jgi:hypothetical protein